MCLPIFIDLCFLEEQLSMLNPSRKKRFRVDTMPNALLREINSALGEETIPLWLVNIKHHVIIVVLYILQILCDSN
jgi:hypothetical protein